MRNQFILGPDASRVFPAWKHLNLGQGLFLCSHPDLSVEHVSLDSWSVTVIGYLLDPSRPGRSDAEILADLVSGLAEGQDLFEIVYALNGRWVLLVDDGSALRLLADAAGLRQVRYAHIGHSGQIWCASQARHIAMAVGLQADPSAMAFWEWSRATNPEGWWPGTSSPYREVKRLLPNHFLDMHTGRAQRFWPNKQRHVRKFDDTAVEHIAEALSAQVHSAAQRFPCAQGLSAGWDSRMLLAASRPISDHLRYYTALKGRGAASNHPDASIPQKLAKRLGLPHDLIDAKDEVSEGFLETLSHCSSFAHTDRFGIALDTERQFYGMHRVGVTGNVSEVARLSYPRTDGDISAKYLAAVARMEHPFAVACFEEWLQGAEPLYGYDVLDLFYWEQRIGSWFSNNCLHFDCAWKDVFAPFNNRKLLVDMLAIDERHREKGSSALYLGVMSKLWPEVLSEPINPHKRPSVLRTIKRFLGVCVRAVRGIAVGKKK